ncbi:MAG: hypothetical protein IT303_17535 [Dehalococcoidia bacterium]|nr:hypothetical protein [Dehalococcoidia bacterium]
MTDDDIESELYEPGHNENWDFENAIVVEGGLTVARGYPWACGAAKSGSCCEPPTPAD